MDKPKYNSITNKSDIVSELSIELDMSLEMVDKNINYIISRLNDVMMREDVVEIQLSNKLGTMYCNKNTVACRRLSLTNDIRFSPHSQKLKDNYERLDKKFKFLKDNLHLNFYSSRFRKYLRHTIRKRYLYFDRTVKEVQDLQNNVYNEHQKRLNGNR